MGPELDKLRTLCAPLGDLVSARECDARNPYTGRLERVTDLRFAPAPAAREEALRSLAADEQAGEDVRGASGVSRHPRASTGVSS